MIEAMETPVPAMPSDAALARVEKKVQHIRAIKRLEWRIAQVELFAAEETARLRAKLAAELGAYERFKDAAALQAAAEAPSVRS